MSAVGKGAIAATALISTLLAVGSTAQAQSQAQSQPYSERYYAGVVITPAFRQEGMTSSELISQESESEENGLEENGLEENDLQSQPLDQIVRFELDVDGDEEEWIRIEQNPSTEGTQLSAYHTSRVRRRIVSTVATGLTRFGAGEALDAIFDDYDGPVITPRVEFHRWADHETRNIVFVPEGCEVSPFAALAIAQQPTQSSCAITGTDMIVLPEDMDISTGQFTIEYLDRELLRTITFQIPQN